MLNSLEPETSLRGPLCILVGLGGLIIATRAAVHGTPRLTIYTEASETKCSAVDETAKGNVAADSPNLSAISPTQTHPFAKVTAEIDC